MLLPDSESSQMRLVIEGSEDVHHVAPETADRVLELKLTDVQKSACCVLI